MVHFKNNQVILPLTMYALLLTQRSESWKVIRFVTQRTSDSYCCTNGNCVLSIHWHAYLKVKYELFCEKNVLEIRSIYWNCELITNWEFDIYLNDSYILSHSELDVQSVSIQIRRGFFCQKLFGRMLLIPSNIYIGNFGPKIGNIKLVRFGISQMGAAIPFCLQLKAFYRCNKKSVSRKYFE